MSSIRTLFTNLAALPITYTSEKGQSKSILGLDLNKAPAVLVAAALPKRVLLPTEAWGSEGSAMERISVGTANPGALMTWNVTDMFLLQGVALGSGLADFLPDLVRYSGGYVTTLLGSILLATGMTLNGLTVTAGVYEYPMGSGNNYYGVEARTTWTELLN